MTWVALACQLIEGIVLIANGWTCPLTIYAEQAGALRGSVTDIFLPKWFADRIFPVCGSLLGLSILLITLRLLI